MEGQISIKGLPVRLYDTAGIHDSKDEIERLGVMRSKKILDKAELILFVHDASASHPEEEELRRLVEGKRIIEIFNKSDLLSKKENGKLYASALKEDVEAIKEAIFDALSLNEEVYVTPALSSPRELALLRLAKADIEETIRLCDASLSVDLVSVPLQSAYNHLRALLGLDPTQDFSKEIFSRFCVGK